MNGSIEVEMKGRLETFCFCWCQPSNNSCTSLLLTYQMGRVEELRAWTQLPPIITESLLLIIILLSDVNVHHISGFLLHVCLLTGPLWCTHTSPTCAHTHTQSLAPGTSSAWLAGLVLLLATWLWVACLVYTMIAALHWPSKRLSSSIVQLPGRFFFWFRSILRQHINIRGHSCPTSHVPYIHSLYALLSWHIILTPLPHTRVINCFSSPHWSHLVYQCLSVFQLELMRQFLNNI